VTVSRPFRGARDRYVVGLGAGERELLAELCRQARAVLIAEDPSSDPALARLFPAAYPDDPLASLEFETNLGDAPRKGKLEAIETVERTVDAQELSEEELILWMGVVNDLRLLLGTRLGITDEDGDQDGDEDDAEDDPEVVAREAYGYLTWLQGSMLDALGAPWPSDDLVAGSD
jgi:Domain of unknown function (DUF2017)